MLAQWINIVLQTKKKFSRTYSKLQLKKNKSLVFVLTPPLQQSFALNLSCYWNYLLLSYCC